MIDTFAITQNVRRFMAGMEVLRKPVKGRIGIMLVYGPYGTGKTEIGDWYYTNHAVPYVRATDGGTRRELLANIVSALEEAPKYRSADIFEQLLNIWPRNGETPTAARTPLPVQKPISRHTSASPSRKFLAGCRRKG